MGDFCPLLRTLSWQTNFFNVFLSQQWVELFSLPFLLRGHSLDLWEFSIFFWPIPHLLFLSTHNFQMFMLIIVLYIPFVFYYSFLQRYIHYIRIFAGFVGNFFQVWKTNGHYFAFTLNDTLAEYVILLTVYFSSIFWRYYFILFWHLLLLIKICCHCNCHFTI